MIDTGSGWQDHVLHGRRRLRHRTKEYVQQDGAAKAHRQIEGAVSVEVSHGKAANGVEVEVGTIAQVIVRLPAESSRAIPLKDLNLHIP